MAHSPRFQKLCDDARARVPEVTTDEVAKRLERGDAFALIDVREESEFARGRIKGAKHMGRGVLERDIEAAYPDLDTDIVLYCGGGFRSLLSGDTLRQMGYRKVVSMAGGWREWTAKGLPTDEGSSH